MAVITAQKGFTLIELLVSVSILIIITGLSVAGVITFNQKQGLEDDAKNLASELRKEYSRATGIFYPPGCTTSLTGYRLTMNYLSKDVLVSALCPNVSLNATGVLKSSHFYGNTTFVINAGDGRITGSPITLEIMSDNDITNAKFIRISDFGLIEILP